MSELRYEGILLSAETIAEERNGRSTVSLPREGVEHIEIRRGPPGERLAVQTMFALLLFALGLAATGNLVGTLLRSGTTIHFNVALGVMFLPLGALILWAAFRPRYYLRLRTANDVRKLGFLGTARAAELAEFTNRARRLHGYEIEWGIDAPPTRSAPFR